MKKFKLIYKHWILNSNEIFFPCISPNNLRHICNKPDVTRVRIVSLAQLIHNYLGACRFEYRHDKFQVSFVSSRKPLFISICRVCLRESFEIRSEYLPFSFFFLSFSVLFFSLHNIRTQYIVRNICVSIWCKSQCICSI